MTPEEITASLAGRKVLTDSMARKNATINALRAEIKILEERLRAAGSGEVVLCPTHGVALLCNGCIASVTSEAKATAARANGLKGGRPHNLRGGRPRKNKEGEQRS